MLYSCIVFWVYPVLAGPLADRLAQFPEWDGYPPTQVVQGDLIYPDWFEGNWNATSTLVELVAPFAPEIVTPGFEANRGYLDQPVTFPVRFVPQNPVLSRLEKFLGLPGGLSGIHTLPIVADRAFNGLSIARAYLGETAVYAVTVAADNPNQQITQLKGNLQLMSIVTQRATETPTESQFITTEISQQIFRGTPNPYLNSVETTTAYTYHPAHNIITANQATAIYLSPNDPDYFKVGNRPIALYRYQLELAQI